MDKSLSFDEFMILESGDVRLSATDMVVTDSEGNISVISTSPDDGRTSPSDLTVTHAHDKRPSADTLALTAPGDEPASPAGLSVADPHDQRASPSIPAVTGAGDLASQSWAEDYTVDASYLPATPASMYGDYRQIKDYLREPVSPAGVAVAAGSDARASELGARWTDDINLVEATLKSEATGTQTPLAKEELRFWIQMNRRVSGLDDLKTEPKPRASEQLSMEEAFKRVQKKERNKVAARKCRDKKKMHTQLLEEECKTLECTNTTLKYEVKKLVEEKKKLLEMINHHKQLCPTVFNWLPTD